MSEKTVNRFFPVPSQDGPVSTSRPGFLQPESTMQSRLRQQILWESVPKYLPIKMPKYLQGSSGDTVTENRCVNTVQEAEGGMIWEKSTETHTSPYVNTPYVNSQWEFAVDTGSSTQCPVTVERGGVGGHGKGVQREGTQVCLWPIHADVWQRPIQYCKAIILQWKRKK